MGAHVRVWGPILTLVLVSTVVGVTLGLVLKPSVNNISTVSPSVVPTFTMTTATITPISGNKIEAHVYSNIISNTAPFQSARQDILSSNFVGVPTISNLVCTDPNPGLGPTTISCEIATTNGQDFVVRFSEPLVVGSYSAPETATGQVHNDNSRSGDNLCGLVVANRPAVFMYGGPGTLFVRATNATGQDPWNAPFLVGPGVAGAGLLWGAVVNEHPACAYLTSSRLEYKRSTSTIGNTWPASAVVVDNMVDGTVLNHIYMVVAENRPLILYNPNANNDTLVVRQGTTPDGDAFSGTVSVATNISLECVLGFAIVDTYPAVAYVSAGTVYFVRATQADGLAWGAPQAVDTDAGTEPIKNGLQVAQGKPIIAYFNVARDTIQIRHAVDEKGVTWPTLPADKGMYPDTGVMQNGSFTVVAGQPCLWFAGHSGNFYRLLYGRDVAGRSWQAVLDETAQLPTGNNSSLVSFPHTTRVGAFEASSLNTLYREFTISGTWRLDLAWQETVERLPT